jgi:hypothetical protein
MDRVYLGTLAIEDIDELYKMVDENNSQRIVRINLF